MKKENFMKYCKHCGLVIRGSQKNCSNCADIKRLANGLPRISEIKIKYGKLKKNKFIQKKSVFK